MAVDRNGKECSRDNIDSDDELLSENKVRRCPYNSARLNRRLFMDKAIRKLFSLTTLFVIAVLGLLLYRIISQSVGWLDLQFLTSNLSISAQKAGIKGVIIGSLLLMLIITPITLIIGVATAVFLEEYVHKGKINSIIKVNISNLSAVPSVIFGLLGLTIFSRLLNLGSSILAGALTLSLLALPIVVVASQEALKSVPGYLREASYAVGATKWTTIRKIVLPAALPGILTGSILAMSRAIGETAPLVVLGVPALILKIPNSIMDNFTSLPVQIYYWTLDSVLVKEYANLAAATIITLLVILFIFNSVAIVIRNKFHHNY